MNRYASLIAAGAVGLFPTFALAQAAPKTADFIKAAAQTDKFERDEGRMAQTQAGSPKVKAFGREMVVAHTKTTAALKAAIANAGLPPPAPPTLTPEQTSDLESLRKLHGAAFDKAYVAQQLQAHQTALGVMQAYAADGDNAVIRKAAADTVPIVQDHLAMAKRLE
jgi:putative membrane protein